MQTYTRARHQARAAALALFLSCGLARAADVSWTGALSSDFHRGENWSTGAVPTDGDAVIIDPGTVEVRRDVDNNFNAIRLKAGALSVTGGTIRATAHPAWDSWVGAEGGSGTVTQTGGTADFNELELGRSVGSTGLYSLGGGDLRISRGVNGYSLYLGGNKNATNAGAGALTISGGAMETRTGVKLGDAARAGTGTFTVLGSRATQIGIGTISNIDGWWEQYAGSTLRVGIDAGGLTKIFIEDADGTNGTYARFERGSLLDVDYFDGGRGGGTWTVLEVENGAIVDSGLAFADGTDTSVWSFQIDNSGSNGRLTVTAAGEPANQLLLRVGETPRQIMKYGLDYERLWFWYGSNANKRLVARWSVVDCDIDYMRVAINCAYELTEGDFDLRAYTQKIVPMMTSMRDANPDVKFFASPRPLNEAIDGARWQPYPRWITGDNGSSFDFDWEKCAGYLLRYLLLMDSYGFRIDFLDVTNEWNYIEPREVKYIREYLIDHLPAGIDVPLIVAPSTWSFSQGVSWLNQAQRQNVLSGFQIAASHNTGRQGTPADFAEKATELGKEIWDSEVHGWRGGTPREEIPSSFEMFDRIRAGFTGLDSWLTIGTTAQGHCYLLNNGTTVTRNVKYYIFQKLCNTSNRGHALDIDLPSAFASTAALIRDDLLTVWVLNNSSNRQAIQIDLGRRVIAGCDVRETRWNESLALEGVSRRIAIRSVSNVSAAIEGDSLYCFEITLDRSGATFVDCNENGTPDACDIASGASADRDGNGVPDDCAPLFVRGEVNADDHVDLSDGIAILSWLFLGQSDPLCFDAADVNDSGGIDLSDGVAVFSFLFLGGAPPPAPGPVDCGIDPTIDALSCEAFEGCAGP